MKILVVDDDKEIAQLLEIYIKNEGYEPLTAYNGKEALTKLHTTPDIALMILDIMMPEMSGIEVIKEVRKDSQIPILILSAKTGDMDKIQGLITGADDYVTKPFHREELLARLKALLKRTGHLNSSDVITLGQLEINTSKHLATYQDTPLTLKGREFDLLAYLAANPGTIITKEQIFNRLWGFDSETSLSVVEVYMSNLRKELKRAGSDLSIRTIRNAGYIVEAPDEQ